MDRLHPHIRFVWTLKWLLFGIVAGIGVSVTAASVSAVDPRAAVIAVAFPICGGGLAVLRYRAFRYEVRDDGVHLRRGVVTRKETFVPAESVQQVDVTEPLLARPFGLVSVQLYTAGVFEGEITIPGIEAERASDLSNRLERLARGERAV